MAKPVHRWILAGLISATSLSAVLGFRLTGAHRLQATRLQVERRFAENFHFGSDPTVANPPAAGWTLALTALSRDLPSTFTQLDSLKAGREDQAPSTWRRFQEPAARRNDEESGWTSFTAQWRELKPSVHKLQQQLRQPPAPGSTPAPETLPAGRAVLVTRAAGWLAASVHEHLANDQISEASDALLDLLRLVARATETEDWRSYQLRLQLGQLSARTGWQLLQAPKLTAATLNELHASFGTLRAVSKLRTTTIAETVRFTRSLNELRDHPEATTWAPPMESGYELPLFPPDAEPASKLNLAAWTGLWRDHDAAFCLKSLQNLTELVVALNSGDSWSSLQPRFAAWDRTVARTFRGSVGSRFRLSQLLLPHAEILLTAALEHDAWMHLTGAAIQVYRFWTANGTWPATLDHATQIDASGSGKTTNPAIRHSIQYSIQNGKPHLSTTVGAKGFDVASNESHATARTLVWPTAEP